MKPVMNDYRQKICLKNQQDTGIKWREKHEHKGAV